MSDTQPSLIPSPKPVRLSASATLALPRWGILLLCLLYILPGLIGRDPWKNADAADFGVMWTMAQHGWQDWLWPNISGLPVAGSGPLTFWLGAICIKLFGGILGAPLAARLAPFCFFLIGAYSVWHTTFILGRRNSAQPMRLAFGGQPEANAYGRMLADGALLIYLGCLGLLMHSHETSVEALFVALIAYNLYRCARYLDVPSIKNACLLGLALGALALTNGLVTPFGLFFCFFVGIFFCKPPRQKHIINLVIAFTVSIAIVIIWWLAEQTARPYNSSPFNAWLVWNASQFGIPSFDSIKYFFKNGIWFFWPAWPYALWAIYAWRREWRSAHVLLPLLFTITFFVLAIFNPGKEETVLLSMLPPLAILAAMGLPTMKRGAINAIDWFSVMTLTICALFIWVAWTAANTGWPAGIAKNAAKLAPGLTPEVNMVATLVALCVTIGWFALVYWRLSRQPSVLWRAVVLSTGGVILCWVLLATLWMPWINYNKSYAGIATEMAAKVTDRNSCIRTNVSGSQRAVFAYFGNVRFEGFEAEKCDYLLLGDRVPKYNRPASPKTHNGMKLIWEGHRPSDRGERFRLYQSVP